MANKPKHDLYGGISGAISIAALNYRNPSSHFALDLAGGIAGGIIGSQLPDRIDPPTSPHHRSTGHGVVQWGYITKLYFKNIEKFRITCFAKADELEKRAANELNEWKRLFFQTSALLLRFMAGFAAGMIPGALSHLLLDLQTKMGLPLLTRGF